MKLNREVSQLSWLEVKHFVLDYSFWMRGPLFGIVLFNFRERSELTSILTSETSVNYYLFIHFFTFKHIFFKNVMDY